MAGTWPGKTGTICVLGDAHLDVVVRVWRPVAEEIDTPAETRVGVGGQEAQGAQEAQGMAVSRVRAQNLAGQAVTPAVLSLVHELSGGRSVEVNRQLIADNAALAAETAVAYTQLRGA